MRVAMACGLALLVAAVAGATAATARPGLDPSYGKDGVVEVPSPFADGKALFTSVSGFGAASDGSAYAVGSAVPCAQQKCAERKFLMRFRRGGRRDVAFGERGTIFLGTKDDYPMVIADGAGRAVVIEKERERIVLRRFERGGEVDGGFGNRGMVELPCACAEADARLLGLPGGRLLVIVSRGMWRAKTSYETVATKVRLFELRPDGTTNTGFGRSGTVAVTIPKRGPLEATARTAGGAILFGGTSWGDRPRKAWLWRLTAAGDADRRFDRNAARSLRRLGPLGRFPDLVSIVPRADGTVAAVGTIHEHLGFVLRLRKDGRLATGFGDRGLAHLSADVDDAVAGIHGAVFVVGQGKRRGYYSAYRVLAGGRLDPGYRGPAGIKVPLPGEGLGVQSLGGGRALVTNAGYFECRQGCPPEPGMARYVE